jgi:hypothetical protein
MIKDVLGAGEVERVVKKRYELSLNNTYIDELPEKINENINLSLIDKKNKEHTK